MRRQILFASIISSFESSISCPCSILDTTYEMKLIAITLEEKVLSSILKDFFAWHVMLIQKNKQYVGHMILTEESTMLGIIELMHARV